MQMFRFLFFFVTVSAMSFASFKPSTEETLVDKIAQTIQSLQLSHTKVWPEYDLSKQPLVVITKQGKIYGFNLSTQNPAWKPVRLDNPTVVYTDQDMWNLSQVSMQDKYQLDGQEVFVFNFGVMQQPGPDFQPLLIMIHELFHKHQFANFAPDADKGNYRDRNNVENLALAHMEEQLLINYLDAESNEEKRRFLRSFAGINQWRKELIAPSSVLWECHQQKMEGLADYSAIKTLDTFGLYETFAAKNHLIATLKSYSQRNRAIDNAVKWRHYGVGATIAYALDELAVPDWKMRVQNGEISLTDALSDALALESGYLDEIKAKVSAHAEFLDLKKTFGEAIIQTQNQIDTILNDYAETKGLVIKIDKPKCGVNGGGQSQGIYHLEDGSTVSVQDSSYSSTTDNLWKLELVQVPFLFQQRSGFRELKLSEEPVLFVDEKQVTIKQLKQTGHALEFATLKFTTPTCTFESYERPGILEIKEGCLEILYKGSPNYNKRASKISF